MALRACLSSIKAFRSASATAAFAAASAIMRAASSTDPGDALSSSALITAAISRILRSCGKGVSPDMTESNEASSASSPSISPSPRVAAT